MDIQDHKTLLLHHHPLTLTRIQLLLNLSVRMTPNLSDKLRRKTDAGKRSNGLKLRLILKATFHKIFTPAQIEILLNNNIKELTGDENYMAVETSINRHLKSDDLLHFGWNVSKRLLSGTQKKLGVTTALFLKRVFR